jgi:hypothetical protein
MSNLAIMKAGNRLASINPQSFEDVQRLAIMAVKAGLSPKAKNDTDEVAIAKATMAIMQGLECDIPPMQALQGIAIINGRAMMYGDLLTALLWSKGFKIKKWVEGTGDDRVGHARITRPDSEVIEKSFSVAQAKKARLWDQRETVKKQWNGKWEEKPNDNPWYRFDYRMLEWRAFGFCVKDGASDATHGMVVREESDPDFNRMVDVTPPDPEHLAIPDIPEIAHEVVQDVEEIPDDPIVDPDALLQQLASDLSACDDAETLSEVVEQYSDLLPRLPKEQRQRAAAMMKEAAE